MEKAGKSSVKNIDQLFSYKHLVHDPIETLQIEKDEVTKNIPTN